MKDHSATFITDEALYLIGFCLRPDEDEADVWILMTSGGELDRPIVAEKKIVFFTTPALALSALTLAEDDLKRLALAPEEEALICDVPGMLDLIETEHVDETATILNCLNTFFDLLRAVKQPLPPDYKRILYAFANHLTFHQEFGTFLAAQQIDRAALREAVEWCLETIFARSKLLSLQNWTKTALRKTAKSKRTTGMQKRRNLSKKQEMAVVR